LVLAACGGGGSSTNSGVTAPPARGPPVTSEADGILHLDQLRAMGFRGGGIRVGVISTGVINLAAYQKANLLPADIYVSQQTVGKLDEGSWMLELLHQHAPDAVLGFCDGEDLDFGGCIKDLANNYHADVIVDDLLFSGQFYPDATASLVASLEANNDKFVFVHLAGNEQNGGYWQGPFTPVSATIGGSSRTVMDFGAASGVSSDAFQAVAVPVGKRLAFVLNWNDPPHGSGNRALSAFLLDSNGTVLSQLSGASDPTLEVAYTNNGSAAQTVRLAVSLDAGSPAGLALQVMEGSATCNIECQAMSYSSAGAAGGSIGDFDDALVVGASFSGSPHSIEAWSNLGPFRLDFSASADAMAADGFDYLRLATPVYVKKPDLVSPDCVTTPFFENGALVNEQFCGTSASAPSIAATVAVLESAGFNRAQVLKSLRGTAVPLGAGGWNAKSGYGLADAAAAYASGGN
jgi:hypothetical protein